MMDGIVLGNVVLHPSAKRVQDSFEAIDFVLKVMYVGDPKSWFPSLLVYANSIIARAPPT